MTREEFRKQLTLHLKRTPFRPFAVVLNTGERFTIDDPQYVGHNVSLDGGAAGYISPDKEVFLFEHADVEEFVEAPAEAGV